MARSRARRTGAKARPRRRLTAPTPDLGGGTPGLGDDALQTLQAALLAAADWIAGAA